MSGQENEWTQAVQKMNNLGAWSMEIINVMDDQPGRIAVHLRVRQGQLGQRDGLAAVVLGPAGHDDQAIDRATKQAFVAAVAYFAD